MTHDANSRPTLAAVARLAGVSPSTASLAFSGSGPVSGATRKRVLAAAAELDYAGPDPRAQSLRRGRSGIVGVIVEERVSEAFRDPIMLAMLDGIADGIGPLGAGLLLLTDTGDGAVSIESAPVDAVVLFGCSPRLGHAVAVLTQRGIPIVVIEGDAGAGVLQILLDNREATRASAEHLFALGHRTVSMVTLPIDERRTRGRVTIEREQGIPAGTAADRLAGARDVFPELHAVSAAASSIEEGLAAGRMLLHDPARRPSAIIAQSDLLAAGVIRAAEELGLAVPADLSVVGFDGVRVDGLAPYDLTTLVQPAVAKGQAAGEAVLRMLAGETPASVRFTSVFHRGNTTAAPRA
ncbi:LacI family DNA-binding transcriptional regulator [Glaciibacter psychrotolerans]|uniref:DNA-binding LacI/PurR family transcriptional regulator n=1 Tax=Glaciibacter psychrotolerans TaxID=670054 RepID=A0A7Z0J760_9MICO|nr:LacI family DNA-binding transcriptional regulator [Leifsonia psychrotolerans]NYJ20946.1 DNA-binding LacI/PurR family transcriptional regulator [Leifsonia psychrotolerans]